MFRAFAFGSLRLGTSLGAALLVLASAPVFLLESPVWAQGNCPNCDLPPGCRSNGNDKDKSNGNGNGLGRPNCERLNITIESDIDFGRVVLLGDGEGRVILDLTTGKKTLIGDVDDLGGMPFTGRATITGAPFEQIMISLPSEVTMRDGQGGNALIRDFVSDVDTFAVLDSFGQLEFRFSATLVLGAEQVAAGNLRGRVPISVEYP